MRAVVLSAQGRSAGYVSYGSNELLYGHACASSFLNGLPMPPLSDLEWQATVRDSAGRVVGRVEIGLLDQLGCYGAIVHRGQGPFVPIGMVNQVENAATLYQYLLPSTSRVNQVGFIEYTSDLEATVMAGATSCHPSARQAGAIRFDPDPLLTARFTVFGNPLWSPQCSIGRPNLFSAGAALLLLFSQA